MSAGERVNDPVWRMPLWKPYAKLLDSKIADINHISSGAFAGSVTAALFLQRFVGVGLGTLLAVFCVGRGIQLLEKIFPLPVTAAAAAEELPASGFIEESDR